MRFATMRLADAPEAVAPDGSAVRILCRTGRGSMAQFSLPAGTVSKPVAHRTVEELWFFVAGSGRMWRRLGDDEEIVAVGPGVALSLPVGTAFQFRSDGPGPLVAVGVTMPPWPGEDEAFAVAGPWPA